MTRNSPSAQPTPTPSAMNGKNDAICFEPGIARREGGGNRFVKNKCVTLRNNMGDNLPAVCFRKDRPVDAVYKQGGQGEEYRGVSYTLNTIDRHDVCFRKASKPSADGKGERWEQGEITNTLNGFEFHSSVRTPEIVCYAPNGTPCGRDSTKANLVVYSVENHPNDSRVGIREDGTVQTLSARCGTGGGNTPMVLIENNPLSHGE